MVKLSDGKRLTPPRILEEEDDQDNKQTVDEVRVTS